MTYALIALILLLVIAPMVAIIPTKKQQAQMQQRRLAMAEGIRVDLTHIDDPDPDTEKYLSNTGKPLERKLHITAYRLYRKHASDAPQTPINWQFDRVAHNWVAVDTDLSLLPDKLLALIQSELKLFSGDVIRIEEKQGLVSVYWHEGSDVDRVLGFLKRVLEIDIK